MTFSFLVSLLLLLWGGTALGGLTITTPQGLIDFSTSINNGNSYSGETVYLDADLDFTPDLSSQFEPIGNKTYDFQGTFDGQGHIIRSLIINSTFSYAGLFGYSYKDSRTIRSVIMDDSCSVVNSHIGYSDIGSIFGYCSMCLIENVVNMASVTFTGNSSNNNFCVSGIVGRLLYSSTVRNCVNYGSVTHSDISIYGDAYIGGIAGLCGSDGKKSIENCANYGTLVHNGTSSNMYMGGIVGYNYFKSVNIENCVSAGKILNITSGSGNTYIGSVVGHIRSSYITTNIIHCFWTSDVGYDTAYGYVEGKPGIYIIVENNSLIELNTTTTDKLDTYASKNVTWNKWFMLHLNGGTINNDINQELLIVTQKHFPDPVKEGNTFSFWCTDAECTGRYYPNTTDITGITDLYAHYQPNTYTIEFYFGNGTKTVKEVKYGEKYGELPETEKEGYTFDGWFTKEGGNGEKIMSETTVSNSYVTLYAHWTINNYTLIFVFNNGGSDEVRILNYSDLIAYPSDPMREGYTFNGWDNEGTTTMPAHNLNITAQWIKIEINISSNFVEIVFEKKGLKEEEIKTIINDYTNEDFTIEKIEFDEETGGTKVIVKFNVKEIAEKFVRDIDENKKGEGTIKRVGVVYYDHKSFSTILHPLILRLFIF